MQEARASSDALVDFVSHYRAVEKAFVATLDGRIEALAAARNANDDAARIQDVAALAEGIDGLFLLDRTLDDAAVDAGQPK
jgi:hypothetical protein